MRLPLIGAAVVGSVSHEKLEFMRRAIRLAEQGMRAGKGGPFGAVVVKDRGIVGEGCNMVTSTNDPTAHAEIVAIRTACRTTGKATLEGCEIYSNSEPCPMCYAAILSARIERIYYANTRADAARIGFDDKHIYREFALPVRERSLPMEQMTVKETAGLEDNS